MDILEAVILGIVQGIGEFLPISSSGHLVIAGELLEIILGTKSGKDEKLLLNVVLHAGTLGSIVVVYWKEIWELRVQPRVCGMLILASIPAAILGFTMKSTFEEVFATPLIAGVALFATAGLLILGQRLEKSSLNYEELPMKSAFFIGLFQAGALVPGISRSGSTIAAGLMLGLQRKSAAAFSFLMAIPVIGGAVLVEMKDVFSGETVVTSPAALVIGGIVSFVVGLACLRWMVNLIAKGKLHWFAYYCVAIGTATVVWQLVATVFAESVALRG
ncbi:MAG: undecaprenyl-diphosphate phosphatase [Planctomycetes bacterium]|nr:undecaprenyl-diphosphate phosphatase [Planctomycetota bacterium]